MNWREIERKMEREKKWPRRKIYTRERQQMRKIHLNSLWKRRHCVTSPIIYLPTYTVRGSLFGERTTPLNT